MSEDALAWFRGRCLHTTGHWNKKLLALLLISCLLPGCSQCGKRNEETSNGDKINCTDNTESLSLSVRRKQGGFISRSTAVIEDKRGIRSLLMPQAASCMSPDSDLVDGQRDEL